MAEFTSKTLFYFEPGMSEAFAVDAVADPAYETPAEHRETLGDLARLRYRDGKFTYKIEFSAAPTTGSVNIRLTDGTNTLATGGFSGNVAVAHGELVADLTNVKGESALRIEVEVSNAMDAGITAKVAGSLKVSSPMVVFGGC